MGLLGTLASGLGAFMNTSFGAAITGGVMDLVKTGFSSWLGSKTQQGSVSSAQAGQQDQQSVMQQGSYSEGSSEQTGSVQGIANLASTALGTPTGNNSAAAGAFNQQSATVANNLQQSWWNNAAMLNTISNVVSNLSNAASQTSAQRYNREEAQAERSWAQSMRQTAYQDTVKDLKAAGLNPILAAQNGATGLGSGAAASVGAQHYNQATAPAFNAAHTASMQAMYEYGNNTAQMLDHLMQTVNTAKQYGFEKVASQLEQAIYSSTHSSAMAIEKSASQMQEQGTQQDKSSEHKTDVGGSAEFDIGAKTGKK
nr:unnamed protein product [uncultured bacterium]